MASRLSSIGVDDRVAMCYISRDEVLFGLERLAKGRCRTELEKKARKLYSPYYHVSRSREPLVTFTRTSSGLNASS